MDTKTTMRSSPRDVLMHLLGVGTLYFSSFWFIKLLFDFINVRFPDPLNPYYDAGNWMRWAIASLIIIFPVFVWISWFLNRDMRQNPEKAELRVRKWLVYLTLFLAAILIIGDLVTLIYNFLSGELTMRFSLKVLSVLAVGGAIFGYYLYDLRKKAGIFSQNAKIFIWITHFILFIVIVGGFFVAGSPFTQRMIRFDNQRVSDLYNLQYQIVNYWQTKSKLPATLNDLRDSISGFTPPVDPETGAEYQYKTMGTLAFELCGTFSLESAASQVGDQKYNYPVTPDGRPFGAEDSWTHGKGLECFPRTIDPELYPPVKKTLP